MSTLQRFQTSLELLKLCPHTLHHLLQGLLLELPRLFQLRLQLLAQLLHIALKLFLCHTGAGILSLLHLAQLHPHTAAQLFLPLSQILFQRLQTLFKLLELPHHPLLGLRQKLSLTLAHLLLMAGEHVPHAAQCRLHLCQLFLLCGAQMLFQQPLQPVCLPRRSAVFPALEQEKHQQHQCHQNSDQNHVLHVSRSFLKCLRYFYYTNGAQKSQVNPVCHSPTRQQSSAKLQHHFPQSRRRIAKIQ